MQPTPRVVPWRSRAEWEDVRNGFYDDTNEKPLHRQRAIETVQVWRSRCRIPFAAEATAFLVEALSMTEGTTCAVHVKRLACSMAIVRFVNGILDPAQQSHFVVPLYTLAKQVGLPAMFVDLRHAATHEQLPLLCVLKDAIERALQWLHTVYWSEKDDREDDEVMLCRQLDHLLQNWKQLRLGQAMKPKSELVAELSTVKCQIVQLFDSGRSRLALCSRLMETVTDIGGRIDERTTGEQFSLWMRLIDAIFIACNDSTAADFVDQLVGAILDAPASSKEANEWRFIWIEHLLEPYGGEESRNWQSSINGDDIAVLCIKATESAWSGRLLELLVRVRPSLLVKYKEDLHSLMRGNDTKIQQGTVDEMTSEVEQRRKKWVELSSQKKKTDDTMSDKTICAWSLCRDWKPAPIGIVMGREAS